MSNKRDLLSGMTCGVLFGGGGGEGGGATSQFATVGGMSFPPKGGISSRGYNVHCIDLQRDLKIVSSHTLVRDSASAVGGGIHGLVSVCDVAANHDRNNIVVGCSDGTIRMLDGGRRQAEVAKAKAQRGGVAHVAVCDVSRHLYSER